MDTIIKNGIIVTPSETFKGDVGICRGKIAAIGNLAESWADTILDVNGHYILPGIIDVHTHINHWGGVESTRDDFFQGSRAAACGGVTTVVDFAIQGKEETLTEAIRRRREQADNNVCIDYGLHANITHLDQDSLAAIESVVSEGYPTFKLFMTFEKAGFMVKDPELYDLLPRISDLGGMVGIHAENDPICETLTAQNLAVGNSSPKYHAESRPNIAEAECISKAILFAETTESALYIFHLTTKEGVDLVRQAQKRGVRVQAETCPHYLVLTDEVYSRPDGQNFIMTPPLRKPEDIDALWGALRDGTLSLVSSDHCCFDSVQKKPGQDNFTSVSPGISGTETLLSIVHHFGVNSGNISINDMVRLLCSNPARLFGLSPDKGDLLPGTDADLVVFDPNRKRLIDGRNLSMPTDYTVYDGTEVSGYPEFVLSKGNIIYGNGEFVGQRGAGRFIKRGLPDFNRS